MSTVYEVPLTQGQNQRLSVSLSNITYNMLFRWCNSNENPSWVVDIMDSDDAPIVQGIPLVTGADLLAQYGYLGFAGQLVVVSDGVHDAVPTFENLGDGSHLYYVTAT